MFWRLTIVPLPLLISEDVQAADLYILPSFGSGGPVKCERGAWLSCVKATHVRYFLNHGQAVYHKKNNKQYTYIYIYTIWAYNVYIAMTYPAVWVEEHPSIPSFFTTNRYIIVKRCNILLPLWLRCWWEFSGPTDLKNLFMCCYEKTHINRLGGVIA